ncbi:hypothetical protein Pan153_11650 [Gimesia panareensis]|uniref:Uncharacterized protein n=1 Tax=Gimesia panareensis TaxID=2527978 RepID=A0A518FJK9_9PLAN|nr:hypothetical protein Pan153_11650 [Gimesia panareensis]
MMRCLPVGRQHHEDTSDILNLGFSPALPYVLNTLITSVRETQFWILLRAQQAGGSW